ncbi:Lipase [Trema orientale]|uniref:Lipase n=1 Tax=Trema orientale TaxID=63057 RepID=A0A2P5ETA7_TREOI|nr:Lipase [Trema orientale]
MAVKERSSVCFPLCYAFVLSLSLSFGASDSSQSCRSKPVMFNFGDSNSDTGGFSVGFGITFGPPIGRIFLHHPNGRLCDGRLMIDFLCESLNMSYLSPYMQSLRPNFTNGANFAVSASSTQPEGKPFNLDIQIRQFLQFRTRSLELISEGFKDLISDEEFNNALYIIDIGQNDLAGSFTYLSYAQVIDQIPSFIAVIQSSIWNLYQNGGKNFWIHNTGPLGCLPQILATIGQNFTGDQYDNCGCIQSLNNAAKEFNKQLYVLCEELRSEMKDATIVYVDIYSIKYGVITNPSIYGFDNPLMACCGYGGPPYNYKVHHACGVPGYNLCDDGSKFISWDGVHYTEAANAIFASKILSTNYSTPLLKSKPVVINFGDSNSDTGGFCIGFGIIFGPPTGRTFFHHPTGRLCDGRLMIDFLCESLNIIYLTPYMQSLGLPNFTNGVNFAVSGSSTQPQGRPFNLDVQIRQFLQFRARSHDLISQGFRDLISDVEFNNALYTIDIGQNDIASSFTDLSYAQVIDQIPSFIAVIQSSIRILYQNGGRNFWIHNTGPLGCLPQSLATIGLNFTGDHDRYGCIKSLNNAAKEFNKQLYALCEELRSEMKDATIVHVDIYSIKYGLITNPSIYGFKNPLMACCGYGGPPHNYKSGRACGVPGYNLCDDGSKFISWDGVHYTEAANAVFASKILSANYSTPPLKFQYFCNT